MYEQAVEAQIREQLGDEKLNKIVMGLKDYIKSSRDKESKSKEVLEAIEVLSSLGDFLEFKSVMLAKKAELNGESEEVAGKYKLIKSEMFDIAEYMDKIEMLAKEASGDDGWVELENNERFGLWIKKIDEGNNIIRFTVDLDLSPKLGYTMLEPKVE